MIKIGDVAVDEQKVVETSSMSSPEKKEESDSEKKSTSTKKSKARKRNMKTAATIDGKIAKNVKKALGV